MTDNECQIADPWGIVYPCDTLEPCAHDGESTLWTARDCGDAPPMWEWCQTYTHPTCELAVKPATEGAVGLPATGGGGLGLVAALLCAAGWACLKSTKAAPLAGGENRERGGERLSHGLSVSVADTASR